MAYKNPESVLVVIHTPDLQVLLLERANNRGYWQSVTGSLEPGENPSATARREVSEETGLDFPEESFMRWVIRNRFEILPIWRDRYAPGVTQNLEHVFSLCIPSPADVLLAPDEHFAFEWTDWKAAAKRCFSWTNRDAILMLPLIQPNIATLTA